MFYWVGDPYRGYYAESTRIPVPNQLSLLEFDDYTYRVIVSNDRRLQPDTLFRAYNGRGNDKKQIDELKNEYALGKMVSGDFSVTKVLY